MFETHEQPSFQKIYHPLGLSENVWFVWSKRSQSGKFKVITHTAGSRNISTYRLGPFAGWAEWKMTDGHAVYYHVSFPCLIFMCIIGHHWTLDTSASIGHWTYLCPRVDTHELQDSERNHHHHEGKKCHFHFLNQPCGINTLSLIIRIMHLL